MPRPQKVLRCRCQKVPKVQKGPHSLETTLNNNISKQPVGKNLSLNSDVSILPFKVQVLQENQRTTKCTKCDSLDDADHRTQNNSKCFKGNNTIGTPESEFGGNSYGLVAVSRYRTSKSQSLAAAIATNYYDTAKTISTSVSYIAVWSPNVSCWYICMCSLDSTHTSLNL